MKTVFSLIVGEVQRFTPVSFSNTSREGFDPCNPQLGKVLPQVAIPGCLVNTVLGNSRPTRLGQGDCKHRALLLDTHLRVPEMHPFVPEIPAIHYTCQRCTNCCRWPGVVRVDENEITAIAAHVRMSEEDFLAHHTRLRPDRRGLSLMERPDGSCEWLNGRDCRLQAVKPAQCRAFPNDWNFPGWREKCEAVPSLVRRQV